MDIFKKICADSIQNIKNKNGQEMFGEKMREQSDFLKQILEVQSQN